LKKGNNYDICAVYETGSTGIYSFSYNDEFIVNEYWHERNFSDRDEKNLPAIVQKAPGQTVTPVPSVEGMESPDTKENNYEELAYETVRLEISIGDNPYKGNDIPMMVAKRDQVSDIIAL